jgi:hypothetical protein
MEPLVPFFWIGTFTNHHHTWINRLLRAKLNKFRFKQKFGAHGNGAQRYQNFEILWFVEGHRSFHGALLHQWLRVVNYHIKSADLLRATSTISRCEPTLKAGHTKAQHEIQWQNYLEVNMVTSERLLLSRHGMLNFIPSRTILPRIASNIELIMTLHNCNQSYGMK